MISAWLRIAVFPEDAFTFSARNPAKLEGTYAEAVAIVEVCGGKTRYQGLIVRDMRCSATRNLRRAGLPRV